MLDDVTGIVDIDEIAAARVKLQKQYKTINLFYSGLSGTEREESKWIQELLSSLEQLKKSFEILEKPLIQINGNTNVLRFLDNFFQVLAYTTADNERNRNAEIKDFFDRFKLLSVPYKSFIASTFYDYNKFAIEANINIIHAPIDPHPHVNRLIRKISRDHSLELTKTTRDSLFNVVEKVRKSAETENKHLKNAMDAIERLLNDAKFPEEIQNLKILLKQMFALGDRTNAQTPALMDKYLDIVYRLNTKFYDMAWLATIKKEVRTIWQTMENIMNIFEKLPTDIGDLLPEPSEIAGPIHIVNHAKLERVHARFEEIIDGIDSFVAVDLKKGDRSLDTSWLLMLKNLMIANGQIDGVFRQGDDICAVTRKTVNLLKAVLQSSARTKTMIEPINKLEQFLKYFTNLQLPFTENESRADYFYSNHLLGFYAYIVLTKEYAIKPDLYGKIEKAHDTVVKANEVISQVRLNLRSTIVDAAFISGHVHYYVNCIRNAVASIRSLPVVRSAQKDELDNAMDAFNVAIDKGLKEFERKITMENGESVTVGEYLNRSRDHMIEALKERNRIQSTLPEDLENHFKQYFKKRTVTESP